MYGVIFLIVLGFVWIIFASVQDLKNKEVANWLNFSLIIFALGFRFFYSLFYRGGFSFFYQGLIGLGIFFVLGNLLYYGRMFAGGDAKLMIAMGAVLPFSESFFDNLNIFLWFLLFFFFVGAFYGLIWSLVLGAINFRSFKKEFDAQIIKNKKLIYFSMTLGLVLMLFGFAEFLAFYFGILAFILPYFYLYAKSVDEVCMVKKVGVGDLTEGDWLYRDVKAGRKLIKKSWGGLSKEDIKLIQRNKKWIVIRQGIPFVPVFLISFIMLLYVWFCGMNFGVLF
ncbi:MAG: prepilin peptidase [Nanoarchaeota archaeon]